MRRHAALVFASCLVLAAVAAVTAIPAAGHGNHLSADAQVVDDHVVFERAFLLSDGYAVVHIDQGGSMGRPIGHVPLSSGPHTNVEIPVDQSFLEQIDGDARVWVTLHRSDGDGEFESNQDTVLTGLQGEPAGTVIPIHVSETGNVNVVARDFGEQRIDDESVTIRRVETDAPSVLVLESDDDGAVGQVALESGTHENVTIDLASSYYESLAVNDSTRLTAVLYRDDGDGSFDASADERVRVGEDDVATSFTVKKVKNASRTTSLVVTAAETAGSTSTASDGPASQTEETAGETPGFHAGVTVLALFSMAAVLGGRAYSRRT